MWFHIKQNEEYFYFFAALKKTINFQTAAIFLADNLQMADYVVNNGRNLSLVSRSLIFRDLVPDVRRLIFESFVKV
jgi:hypothetical protein